MKPVVTKESLKKLSLKSLKKMQKAPKNIFLAYFLKIILQIGTAELYLICQLAPGTWGKRLPSLSSCST